MKNWIHVSFHSTESSKYYARIHTAVARGRGLPACRLAGHHNDPASKLSLCYFSFIFWVDGHAHRHNLQSGNLNVYWLWLLLHVSAVSVVIVIIAICDMPRQEFSFRERVYIHNAYMKTRKSSSETRRKFRIKFPGVPVPNSSKIRREAKIFKETSFVKNRKVNRRRHVLTEETLDEIGERLEDTPQKSLKCLS